MTKANSDALAELATVATEVHALLSENARAILARCRWDHGFLLAWRAASDAWYEMNASGIPRRLQDDEATGASMAAFDAEWSALARTLPAIGRGGSS